VQAWGNIFPCWGECTPIRDMPSAMPRTLEIGFDSGELIVFLQIAKIPNTFAAALPDTPPEATPVAGTPALHGPMPIPENRDC
jgi:hypothetical protein